MTPWTASHTASLSLSLTISQSFPKFMSIESLMPSNLVICCCPLFLLPSTFPSIRVFFNELALHIRWPKYWNFSFTISPSKEWSGLISFRIDWFNPLATQRTLKSLLQHHSSKVSNLLCSTFFMVQLFHPYINARKTIANLYGHLLAKWSLLFNRLSKSVIAFLPRSSRLLISWLQSPSAVISEPKKRNSFTASTFSPSICHEVMRLDTMIFVLSY